MYTTGKKALYVTYTVYIIENEQLIEFKISELFLET